MKKLLFIIILFASCQKDDICQPVTNLTNQDNLISWEGNSKTYTVERYDLDGLLAEVITTDKRYVQIDAMLIGYVRVKSECGQWSKVIYL